MIFYQHENFGKTYEYRSNPHTNWKVPPHIHEFSEIAFPLSGVMTVYIGGKKYEVHPGELVFILPNQIHEYTDETASAMRCAVFSNDHIPCFFQTVKDTVPASPVVDLSDAPELLRAIDTAAPTETMKLCGLLHLVCDRLLKQNEFVPRTAGDHTMFHEAIRYISENFRQDIKLSDVAKKLGYHEKYLSGALHALTNMNFRTLLASYRISCAKELLRAESARSLRISDVALQCGFSSINTFHRAFREITGTTPKQYLAGKHATKQTN